MKPLMQNKSKRSCKIKRQAHPLVGMMLFAQKKMMRRLSQQKQKRKLMAHQKQPHKNAIMPRIMGIINVSVDSFYQANSNFSDALTLAEKMIEDGADILDIGAVATNPNLESIRKSTAESECEKIIPLIKSIRKNYDILISVDTS